MGFLLLFVVVKLVNRKVEEKKKKKKKYSDAKAPKQANLCALASEYFMHRQVRYFLNDRSSSITVFVVTTPLPFHPHCFVWVLEILVHALYILFPYI